MEQLSFSTTARPRERRAENYPGLFREWRTAIRAAALAERGGEVRFVGEVDASEDSMRRVLKRIKAAIEGFVPTWLLRGRDISIKGRMTVRLGGDAIHVGERLARALDRWHQAAADAFVFASPRHSSPVSQSAVAHHVKMAVRRQLYPT